MSVRSATRRAVGVLVLAAALAGSSAAQQLETPSFVFARYATRSSSSLYAVRGVGPLGAMVAMVQNPATHYRELIAGAATQVGWNDHSALLAAAFADASDGAYVQAYLLPVLALGRLTLTGSVEWYVPLVASGTRQLYVNPLSAMLRAGERLAVGGAYTLGVTAGARARHRAGPAVEWTSPVGVWRLEVLQEAGARALEIRTAAFVTFP